MDLPIFDPKNGSEIKHHFVPNKKHGRRAKLLSHQAFIAYTLVLALILGTFKLFVPTVAPGVLGYASNITKDKLLIETNKTREKNGRQALKENPILTAAAEKKAAHMFEENYWSHVSPSGVTPWDFILGSGYDYEYAGENLAKNFNDSTEVIQAWFNSKSHRDNLLSSKYEEVGFAVVNGVLDGYETTLVVQMFGTTKDSSFLAEITPTASSDSLVEKSVIPQPTATDRELVPAKDVPGQEKNLRPVAVPTVVIQEPATLGASLDASLDISYLPKYVLSLFVLFLIALLSIDVWYSHKKGVIKLNGHTLAHIVFLSFILITVWYVINPGTIL